MSSYLLYKLRPPFLSHKLTHVLKNSPVNEYVAGLWKRILITQNNGKNQLNPSKSHEIIKLNIRYKR